MGKTWKVSNFHVRAHFLSWMWLSKAMLYVFKLKEDCIVILSVFAKKSEGKTMYFHPLRLLFGLLGLAHDSLTCPNQYSQQNQITFWIRSKFYEISRKLFQKSNFIFTLLISFVTLKRRTNYYDANFDNSSKPFANGQKIPTSMTQRESLCKLLLKTCHVIRSLVEFLPSSKRHTTQVCKWRASACTGIQYWHFWRAFNK